MGGSQSQSGHGGEERNSQLQPGLELPFILPVAQRCITEYQGSFPGGKGKVFPVL
jgi:hypothetical protein